MPANSTGPLNRFLVRRAQFVCDRDACRTVTESSVVCEEHGTRLASYVADRAPLFYRKLEQIVADLHAGYFLTAFRDTLAKLPTAQSFKESHFAEILAGLFAEDVHGLYRLYSKLSLLTAENANAYKMDLLFCDPATDPVTFLFAEVKSSCKSAADGLPAGHDKSCFADLFATFKKYDDADLGFDLTVERIIDTSVVVKTGGQKKVTGLPRSQPGGPFQKSSECPDAHSVQRYVSSALVRFCYSAPNSNLRTWRIKLNRANLRSSYFARSHPGPERDHGREWGHRVRISLPRQCKKSIYLLPGQRIRNITFDPPKWSVLWFHSVRELR
jgi:hypothetical protein